MRTKGAKFVREAGKHPSSHRKHGEIHEGAASQESHGSQAASCRTPDTPDPQPLQDLKGILATEKKSQVESKR